MPLRSDGQVDTDREPITLDQVRLNARGSVYREFFDISLRDQDTGRYRLEVEVTDRIRGETRRRVVELTLVD